MSAEPEATLPEVIAVATDPTWKKMRTKVRKLVREEKEDAEIIDLLREDPATKDCPDLEEAVRSLIDAAREALTNEKNTALEELNAKHAVVIWSGRTVVLTEAAGGAFTLSSFQDLKNWYSNRFVGKRLMGAWWLRQRQRRQYESVVFAPEKTAPGVYNLWKGFGVTPAPGDCSLFLALVKDIICCGDETLYKFVMAWCADLFQNPCDRPGTSIVLRGASGVGKGTFARILGDLVSRAHFQHVTKSEHLVGRFNAHLAHALVVFCDESFFAGDKAHEGVLKAFITEPTHSIEFKGKDLIRVDNFARLIIASNKEWVVPAEMDDRRFCMLDVANTRAKDTEYFGALATQMKNGGHEALLHYLLNYDRSGVNLRKPPETDAKLDQVIRSMTPVTQFWYRRLNDGCQIATQGEWKTEVLTGDLFDEYARSAGVSGESRRGHETSFGMRLAKMCPGVHKRQATDRNGNATKVYVFPDLEQCRKEFSKENGGRGFVWDADQGAVRTERDTLREAVRKGVEDGLGGVKEM